MTRATQAASFVLQSFRHLLALDRTFYEEIGHARPIPTFPDEIIIHCSRIRLGSQMWYNRGIREEHHPSVFSKQAGIDIR
jgi:hypothetical protein